MIRPVAVAAAVAVVLAGFTMACSDSNKAEKPGPRVLILGLDGMDYGLTRKMLERGELPTLGKLAKIGGFGPLETSTPPQSPSAWSNFITGLHPGYHAIFDFVQRDPATLTPYLSTSEVAEPRTLKLGSLAIPLGGGEPRLLRREKPFWWYLSQAGIPATVIKIPAHFPPRDDGDARVITDMGTPDLLGTYGTYSLFTDDPVLLAKRVSGGRVEQLARGEEGSFTGRLEGPPSPFSAEGDLLWARVEVLPDRANKGALIRVGDQEILLGLKEWSGWVSVEMEIVPGVYSLHGMARVYLKSLKPRVTVYISPLNIDPLDQALPVSSPPEYAAELASAAGRFYTQGMPEDTKALSGGILSEEEFLAQAELVLRERRRMLGVALEQHKSGLLFFYFGTSDQVGHMFFRHQDTTHAGFETGDMKYSRVLKEVYRKLDDEVARAWKTLGPDDLFLVISDHGFGPASYLFDINAWLQRQGYLALKDSPGEGILGHVDWERTQAYGLGLNGLYLNLKGREKYGAVPPERADELMEKISGELLSLLHPATGGQVVTEMTRPDKVYKGPALDRAPDLIVGYGPGFKINDASAMGGVGPELYKVNRGAWGGDHCGDHRLVPGVIFSNKKLRKKTKSLLDLPPTILRQLGVEVPKLWVGSSVLVGHTRGGDGAK